MKPLKVTTVEAKDLVGTENVSHTVTELPAAIRVGSFAILNAGMLPLLLLECQSVRLTSSASQRDGPYWPLKKYPPVMGMAALE